MGGVSSIRFRVSWNSVLEAVMRPQAIEHAVRRLTRAKRAAQDLMSADCFTDAESAWIDFLIAFNGIYSKLEQGVKGNGAATAWFGRKKNERKKNETLRYLHHARNSEEHGIERVVNEYGGFDSEKLKFGERLETSVKKVDKATGELIGPEIPVLMYGPTIRCVRVFDRRYNDYCDPPKYIDNKFHTVHLEGTKGGDIRDIAEFPLPIAAEGLMLIEDVLKEAESYCS